MTIVEPALWKRLQMVFGLKWNKQLRNQQSKYDRQYQVYWELVALGKVVKVVKYKTKQKTAVFIQFWRIYWIQSKEFAPYLYAGGWRFLEVQMCENSKLTFSFCNSCLVALILSSFLTGFWMVKDKNRYLCLNILDTSLRLGVGTHNPQTKYWHARIVMLPESGVKILKTKIFVMWLISPDRVTYYCAQL